MAADKMEGQMDFLGLIEEYTDDQGARVRVKSPAVKKPRISAGTDANQFKLDFIDLDEEFEREQAVAAEPEAGVVEPEARAESSVDKTDIKEDTQPSVAVKPVTVKAKIPEAVKEEKTKQPKTRKPAAVKAKIPGKVVEEAPPAEIRESVAAVEPEVETKVPVEKKEAPSGEILFKQCKRCWCRDCKHNSRNEGVPREMCGMMIPCPACQGCIDEDMATICEIGNAKEGCMFRAVEEGIFVPDEM